MAANRASKVRVLAARGNSLTFDHTFSMRLRSGLQGGRNQTSATFNCIQSSRACFTSGWSCPDARGDCSCNANPDESRRDPTPPGRIPGRPRCPRGAGAKVPPCRYCRHHRPKVPSVTRYITTIRARVPSPASYASITRCRIHSVAISCAFYRHYDVSNVHCSRRRSVRFVAGG